jgi:hypothetical protein
VLLALTLEELAKKMLLLKKRNDPKFCPGNLQRELWGHFTSGQQIRAAPRKRDKSGSVRSVGMASGRGIDRV